MGEGSVWMWGWTDRGFSTTIMLVPETNRRDGLKGLILPRPQDRVQTFPRETHRVCFQDWEVLSALLGQGFVGLLLLFPSKERTPASGMSGEEGGGKGRPQGYSAGGP